MAHPNARVERKTEERHERRRRDSGTIDRLDRLTLAIPDSAREENPGFNFRWVNDDRNRIHNMTQFDDWDKVESVEPVIVGTNAMGAPMKAHLCKKRTEFCREDHDKQMADLKEQEMGMIQGVREGAAKDNLPDDLAYVPGGRNSINRGSSKPT